MAVNFTGFVVSASGASSQIAEVFLLKVPSQSYEKAICMTSPSVKRGLREGQMFYTEPRLPPHLQQWDGTQHVIPMDKWQRVFNCDPSADQREIWEYCSVRHFLGWGWPQETAPWTSEETKSNSLSWCFPKHGVGYHSSTLITLNLKWKLTPFPNLFQVFW